MSDANDELDTLLAPPGSYAAAALADLRAANVEIARLRAENERMRPVVEAALKEKKADDELNLLVDESVGSDVWDRVFGEMVDAQIEFIAALATYQKAVSA